MHSSGNQKASSNGRGSVPGHLRSPRAMSARRSTFMPTRTIETPRAVPVKAQQEQRSSNTKLTRQDWITVTLDRSELDFAGAVGFRRQSENLRDARTDRYGCPQSLGWQMHIEGAIGEAVFAKHMGMYWSGALGDLDADDVGRYQVRTCNPAGKSRQSLILHEADKDDRIFALVLGLYIEKGKFVYKIPGWIRASEGKKQDYWWEPKGNGRPAFFVPWEDLNPMSTIPKA